MCDLSVINGLAAECTVQNHGGLIFTLLEVNFLQTLVILFSREIYDEHFFVIFYHAICLLVNRWAVISC